MVLFFVFTIRYGGSTAPYKKVFTNAGGDVGIGPYKQNRVAKQVKQSSLD